MPSKRIILMYISDVSGHRSATMAIEKALLTIDPAVETLSINAFNYTNPISEKIVNKLYMGVIQRTPGIWDYLYDNPAVARNIEKLKRVLHKINYAKLQALFDKFRPDVVVCTQAYPCGMVADFKKSFQSKFSLVAVLTDHVPHSYWIYDNVNYYIVPSEEVKVRLIKKGITPDKIKAFGIPFDQKFNSSVSKPEVLQRLNLDPAVPIILVMGGGNGLGPMKTIMKSLEKIKQDLQVIVIAGINKRLYKSLKRFAKKCKKKILVYGFVDTVHELMDISKFIITKPGGITTAEALAKRLPMVIVKPIPGQEANNALYLMKKGAAIKVNEPKETHLVAQELLDSGHKLDTIRQAIEHIRKPNASMDIAKLLLEL